MGRQDEDAAQRRSGRAHGAWPPGAEALSRAAQALRERQASYGPPAAALEAVARRWTLVLGVEVTPAQVALCMIEMKLARLAHEPGYADGPVDVIGYAAIVAELAPDGA